MKKIFPIIFLLLAIESFGFTPTITSLDPTCLYDNNSGDGKITYTLNSDFFSENPTVKFPKVKITFPYGTTNTYLLNCSTVTNGTRQCYITIVSLPSGSYNFQATDNNGTTNLGSQVTKNLGNTVLKANYTVTNASCNSSGNINYGNVNITASGGISPYYYYAEKIEYLDETRTNIYPYSTSNVISNLDPGTYLLKVKDSKGCEILEKIKITPIELHLNFQASSGSKIPLCPDDKLVANPKFDFKASYKYSSLSVSNFSIEAAEINLAKTAFNNGALDGEFSYNYNNVTSGTVNDIPNFNVYITDNKSTGPTANCKWGPYKVESFTRPKKITFDSKVYRVIGACEYSPLTKANVTNIVGGTPPYRYKLFNTTAFAVLNAQAFDSGSTTSSQPITADVNTSYYSFVIDGNNCVSTHFVLLPAYASTSSTFKSSYEVEVTKDPNGLNGCDVGARAIIYNVKGDGPFDFLTKYNAQGSLWDNVGLDYEENGVYYTTPSMKIGNIIGFTNLKYQYVVSYINIKDAYGCYSTKQTPDPNATFNQYSGLTSEIEGFISRDYNNILSGTRRIVYPADVTNSSQITYSFRVDSISCYNLSDGSLTINNFNGGVDNLSKFYGKYKVIFNGKIYNNITTSLKIDNIPPGTYQLKVYDFWGCQAPDQTIVFKNPFKVEILSAYKLRDELCGTSDNYGKVVIKVNGARKNSYKVSIDTFGKIPTLFNYTLKNDTLISNPPSGFKAQISVRDEYTFTTWGKSCIATYNFNGQGLNIIAPKKVLYEYSKNDETCNNSKDGQIQIYNAYGGSGYPLIARLTSGTFKDSIRLVGSSSNWIFKNLSGIFNTGKTYSLLIYDSVSKCEKDTSIILDSYKEIKMGAINIFSNPVCNDSIGVEVYFDPVKSGGVSTTPFSYFINNVEYLNPSFVNSGNKIYKSNYLKNVPGYADYSIFAYSKIAPSGKNYYCFSDTVTKVFNIPAKLNYTISTVGNSCSKGDLVGKITLSNPVEGTTAISSGYTFQLKDASGNLVAGTNNVYSKLPGGYYFSKLLYNKTSNVTCTSIDSSIYIEKPSPFYNNLKKTDALCYDSSNGKITFFFFGGPQAASYNKQLILLDTEKVFTTRTLPYTWKMPAGNYKIGMRNDNDLTCIDTVSVTINKPKKIKIDSSFFNIVNPSCISPNASIEVTLNSITGDKNSSLYYYAISNKPFSDPTKTILNKGNPSNIFSTTVNTSSDFYVIAYDSSSNNGNCYSNETKVSIQNSSSGSMDLLGISEKCYGSNDGQIVISNVLGVGASYKVEYRTLNDARNNKSYNTNYSNTIINLTPDTFEIRLTAFTCSALDTVIVPKIKNQISFTSERFTDAICSKEPEMYFKSISGGTAPYYYYIKNTPTISYPYNRVITLSGKDTIIIGNKISAPKTLFATGVEYLISVRDANGCAPPTNQTYYDTIGGYYDMEVYDIKVLPSKCFSDTFGEINFKIRGIDGNVSSTSKMTNISGIPITRGNIIKGTKVDYPLVYKTVGTETFYGIQYADRGYYSLDMSTDKGCILKSTFAENPLTSPDSVYYNTAFKDVTCYGGNDGMVSFNLINTYNTSIGFTPVGGFWSVEIFKVLGNTLTPYKSLQTNVANSGVKQDSLFAGDYKVTVRYSYKETDYIGFKNYTSTIKDYSCVNDTFNVKIKQNDKLVTFRDTTDLSCYQSGDGSISLFTSGGVAPYKYALFDKSFSSQNKIIGLYKGIYNVVVKDSKDCLDTILNINVKQPDILSFQIDSSISFNVNCKGKTTGGQIGIKNIIGGKGSPYQYSYKFSSNNYSQFVNIPSNKIILNNLSPQLYDIKIRDNNQCESTPISMEIIEPNEVYFTLSQIASNTCFNKSEAQIEVTATGGNSALNSKPRYSYTIGDVNSINTSTYSSNIFTGLKAGTYRIYVLDSAYKNGVFEELCTSSTQTFTINTLDTIDFTPVYSDFNCNYDASTNFNLVDIKPYSALMQYSIRNAYTNTNIVTNVDKNSTSTLTDSGTYIVKLAFNIDNTCFTEKKFTIYKPDSISTYSKTIQNVTCNNSNNGTYTLLPISNRKNVVNYQLENVLTGAKSIETSAGFTLTDLDSGIYRIYFYYNNTCVQKFLDYDTITEPTAVTFNLDNVNSSNVSCYNKNDGKILINNYKGGNSSKYYYSINNAPKIILKSDTVSKTLLAGSYSLYIEDTLGCKSSTEIVNITQPDTFFISSFSQIDKLNCYGDSIGKYKMIISGGPSLNLPYSDKLYSVYVNNVKIPLANKDTLKNMKAGIYEIKMYDSLKNSSSSCVTTSKLVIDTPKPISFDLNFFDFACNKSSFAEVGVKNLVIPSGSTSSFRVYKKNTLGNYDEVTTIPIISGNLFKLTDTGSYQLILKTSDSCQAIKTFKSVRPDFLGIVFKSLVNPDCFGATTGKIRVEINGGTRPIDLYAFNGNDYISKRITSTSNTIIDSITNLSANTYKYVNAVDANNCYSDTIKDVILKNPPVFDIDYSYENESCFNAKDAKINFNFINSKEGTGTIYTFDVGNSVAPKTFTLKSSTDKGFISGLSPGTYKIQAFDSSNCPAQINGALIKINPVKSVDFTVSNLTKAKCFNSIDGGFTIDATGGPSEAALVKNYKYYVNNVLQTSNVISNLSKGVYNVIVKDTISCVSNNKSIQVYSDTITFNYTLDNFKCSNSTNATLTVNTASGLTSNSYFIELISPSSVTTYPTLGIVQNITEVGLYQLNVKDATNMTCFTSKIITTSKPTVLNVTEDLTAKIPTTCSNSSDGGITFSITGGSAPYTISFLGRTATSTTGTSVTINNIPSGNTLYNINDANNCKASLNSILTFGPSVDFSLDNANSILNISCFDSTDGKLSFTIPPTLTDNFSYNIFGGTFTNKSTKTILTSKNFSISNLPANSYDVTIYSTTNNVCQKTITTNITKTSVRESFIFSSSPISCKDSSDGIISIIFGNRPNNIGVSKVNYTIASVKKTLNVNNKSDTIISNLKAGTYSVEVVYDNIDYTNKKCYSLPQNVTVSEPNFITFGTNTSDVTCYGGSNGSIGVKNIVGGNSGVYLYDIISTTNSTQIKSINASSKISNLKAGSYNVSVKDSKGCVSAVVNNTLTQPDSLDFINTFTSTTCDNNSDGTLNFKLASSKTTYGGVGPYQFSIAGIFASNGGVFTNLAAGNYLPQIKDNQGCIKTGSIIKINSGNAINIEFFDTIGPLCNGDKDAKMSFKVNSGATYIRSNVYKWNGSAYVQVQGLIAGSSRTYSNFEESGNFYVEFRVGSSSTNFCKEIKYYKPEVISKINISHETISPTCFGSTDGTIKVYAFNGPNSNYTYNLQGITTNSTGIFTGYGAKNGVNVNKFNVFVSTINSIIKNGQTNTRTCYSDTIKNITLIEPTDFSLKFDAIAPTCSYLNDAKIVIDTAILGTSFRSGFHTYTYTVTDVTAGNVVVGTNNAINNVYSGLTQGKNYKIKLDRNDGCFKEETKIIPTKDAFALFVNSTSTPTCFGGSDGTITYSINGGANKYITYKYLGDKTENNNFKNTFTIDSLESGKYLFQFFDDNNCKYEDIVTINTTEKVSFDFDIANSSDPKCFNSTDGKIKINSVIGGSNKSGYQIAYSTTLNDLLVKTGSSIPVNLLYENLNANYYYFRANNVDKCLSDIKVYKLNNPTNLILEYFDSTNITCFGTSSSNDTGSIRVLGSGGSGSYVYSIDGGLNYSTGYSNVLKEFKSLENNKIYNVIVKDQSGCTTPPRKVILNEPPNKISFEVLFTDLTCYGQSDARFQIYNTKGGNENGSYYYKYDSLGTTKGPYPISTEISGLSTGTYAITLFDYKNCASDVFNQKVSTKNKINYTMQTTIGSCFGANNGIITFGNPSGGSGAPYTYSIDGFITSSSSKVFEGLPPNTYNVNVRDSENCSATSSTQTVVSYTDITFNNPTSTQLICGNVKDATISISNKPTGGTGIGYKFIMRFGSENFEISTTSTAPYTFRNLGAGEYTIKATDSRDCFSSSKSVTIYEIKQFKLNIDSYTPSVTCFGDVNGSITLSAKGGPNSLNPNYNFYLDGVLKTSNIISSLAPKIYYAYATDQFGATKCFSDTLKVEIKTPNIVDFSYDKKDLKCYKDLSGSITLKTPTGGSGIGYKYTFDGGTNYFDITIPISPIPKGTYNITLKDLLNCKSLTKSVQIIEPDSIMYDIDLVSQVKTCYGSSSGKVNVINVSGGNGNYSYSYSKNRYTGYSSSVSTSKIEGLPAGTFFIRVSDFKGCKSNDNANKSFTILENDPINFSVSDSIVSCFDKSDGGTRVKIYDQNQIEIIGQYYYSLNNSGVYLPFSSTNEKFIPSLEVGNHTVNIKDDAGCVAKKTGLVIIDNPSQIILNYKHLNIVCNGDNNGEIIINPSGGEVKYRPFKYSIDNGINYFDDSIFKNLPAGNYALIIKDNSPSECKSLTVFANISEPKPMEYYLNVTNIPVCEKNNNIGGILFYDNVGGTPPYIYSIDKGVTYKNEISFQNLPLGDYLTKMKDSKGCESEIKSASIKSDGDLTATTSVTPITCPVSSDGIIRVYATGGKPPYTFKWDHLSNITRIQTLPNLYPGKYFFNFTDANGCVSKKFEAIISDVATYPVYAKFITTKNTANIFNPIINVQNLSIDANSYLWYIFGTNYTFSDYDPGQIEFPNKAGVYELNLVTRNSHGCSDTASQKITITNDFKFPPNLTFSPNNDGVNDYFAPINILVSTNAVFESCRLKIIEYSTNAVVFTDSKTCIWDGNASYGQAVSSGIYYYFLDVVVKGNKYSEKGQIYVLR